MFHAKQSNYAAPYFFIKKSIVPTLCSFVLVIEQRILILHKYEIWWTNIKILIPVNHTFCQQIHSCTESLWPTVSGILIQRSCSLYRSLYMLYQH